MQRQRVPILVKPLVVLVTAVAVAAGGALFMSISTAHAEIDGPCQASIAGVAVGPLDPGNRDDDIPVSENQQVFVEATAGGGFESHRVELEFAGTRWTVSDESDDGGDTSWREIVNVDDYATYGVGLYKVIGVSTLSDGSTCEGSAVVDVGGNPLTTVAGGVALGGGLVAIGGAVATTTRSGSPGRFGGMLDVVEGAFNDERRRQAEQTEADRRREAFTRPETPPFSFLAWLFGWCVLAIPLALLLPVLALVGGGGDEPKDDGEDGAPSPAETPAQPADGAPSDRPSLPRPPWTPRITLVGLVSGFIGGVAAVVLMQQYSIEYPTLAVVLRTVIVTTIIGGILLPTLGLTFAWYRARSTVVAWERELGWRD